MSFELMEASRIGLDSSNHPITLFRKTEAEGLLRKSVRKILILS